MYFINFSGEAITSTSLVSNYQRRKSLSKKKLHLVPTYINLEPVQHNLKLEKIILFDPKSVLENILIQTSLQEVDSNFKSVEKGAPSFVLKMKSKYSDDMITGYCDSPAAKRIFQTVPDNEFPPGTIFGHSQ